MMQGGGEMGSTWEGEETRKMVGEEGNRNDRNGNDSSGGTSRRWRWCGGGEEKEEEEEEYEKEKKTKKKKEEDDEDSSKDGSWRRSVWNGEIGGAVPGTVTVDTDDIRRRSASGSFPFFYIEPGRSSGHLHGFSDVPSHGNNSHDELGFTGDQQGVIIDCKDDQLPKPAPIYLQFTEVRCKVVVDVGVEVGWRRSGGRQQRKEKEILHGITGSVGAGEMLAMMGPSGSGKSTLLNVLGGRYSRNQLISGSILYNNVPYSKNLKRRIGFVMQDDVLFPSLTVMETVAVAGALQLGHCAEKIERVEAVLAHLGLQHCRDTPIGSQFVRGISGGERKRVCIAQEILTNPSLLFLDEPTSGLDSTTALRLITLLRTLAHQGLAVMATVHQPSSRAFHMFDKLILLSDGHSAYFGKAQEALSYFESIGFVPLIPMNPADFLLDLCSGDTSDISIPDSLKKQHGDMKRNEEGRLSESVVLAKDVKKYLADCCEEQISELDRVKSLQNQKAKHGITPDIVTSKQEWSTSWWEQFSILFIRGFKARRNDYLSWSRVIQVVFSAFLGGCIWWKSRKSTMDEMQDQAGLIFFIGVFWGYFPLFTAIFTFPIERPILAKERAANMYRMSAYFMARTLSDLPIELGLSITFILILYFMTNLRRTIATFLFTLLTVCLDVITSQGAGFFIGAVMMDVQKASTLASIFVMAFMLVGGYFVQKMPTFIGWLKYISFQAHTYEILTQVQFGHLQVESDWKVGYQKSLMAMVAMVFGYRLLAYVALRCMKI